MSTTSPENSARRRRASRASRWLTPAFALVLGVFFFVVAVAQDDWGGAWFSLALFTGYGILLAFLGSRVEVIGLLRGDTTDERAAQIHLRAAAFAFYVLVLVLTGGFIVSLVTQSSVTDTFAALGAVAGVSLIGAYVVLARRS
ncbi:MAG TPA: DUF2178 domain-containing protein [Actinomycetes bacterium]|nr:DUF2178 domain-containing protein [Actinomycetes bacterium]